MIDDHKQAITTPAAFSSTMTKLMARRGINMSQLHKQTGVPLTTINRMVNESNVNPTISTLIPIAEYFGITLNQLMGIDPLDPTMDARIPTKKNIIWTEVPIITWEQSVQWSNTNPKPTKLESVSTDANISDQSFALIIEEANLEGFIQNTIIIVDPTATYEHGDYVVMNKSDQKKASLKQLLIDDGQIYIRPLNKDFQTRMIDDSYNILGVVVQIRMDRKK